MPVRPDNQKVGTDPVDQRPAAIIIQPCPMNALQAGDDSLPCVFVDARRKPLVLLNELVGVDAYVETAETSGAFEELEVAEMEEVEGANCEYTASQRCQFS